ncbi:hypothetical protein SLE2022_389150 [Rubroshorea leprosula]
MEDDENVHSTIRLSAEDKNELLEDYIMDDCIQHLQMMTSETFLLRNSKSAKPTTLYARLCGGGRPETENLIPNIPPVLCKITTVAFVTSREASSQVFYWFPIC